MVAVEVCIFLRTGMAWQRHGFGHKIQNHQNGPNKIQAEFHFLFFRWWMFSLKVTDISATVVVVVVEWWDRDG